MDIAKFADSILALKPEDDEFEKFNRLKKSLLNGDLLIFDNFSLSELQIATRKVVDDIEELRNGVPRFMTLTEKVKQCKSTMSHFFW